jgi:hypothetical protein
MEHRLLPDHVQVRLANANETGFTQGFTQAGCTQLRIEGAATAMPNSNYFVAHKEDQAWPKDNRLVHRIRLWML